MKSQLLSLTFFVLSLIITSNAYSADSMSGKVVLVEPGYMPGTVFFIMEKASYATAPGCPDKAWLTYSSPNIDKNKALLTIVTTALMGKKSVNTYLTNGTCNVESVHLTTPDETDH